MVYLKSNKELIKKKKKGFYDMKKLYTFKAVTDFIESGLVINYKVTKAEKVGFNDMEGNIYHVNVKIETAEGYRNKLVTFEINDTYLDDDDDESETLKQHIENLLFCFYAFN